MTRPDPTRPSLDRRGLLLALAAGLPVSTLAQARPAERFFRRHGQPIGIQLHTFGPTISQDFPRLLKQVSAIGYRTVQLSSYFGRAPAQLRQDLDEAGLECPSLHLQLRPGQDYARLAADARIIGFSSVIVPIFAFPGDVTPRPLAGEMVRDAIARVGREMSVEDWKRQAERLNDAGRALGRHGLRVGYHNHNIEFAPIAAHEKCGFEILLAETDPALVVFELDVGWAAAAGRDPVDLFDRHRGRFGLMHVKDLKASTSPNFALRLDPVEVGAGRLDWRRILPAAFAAGVRQFFVEQEPPFARDRLEAAKISFDFLSRVT